jgi:CRP-like cAMP-binding protein
VVPVLARQPKAGRAVAHVDSTTLEIPTTVFLNALEENFSLVRNSLRMLSTALLAVRGNLPAKPDDTRKVEMGEYLEGNLTMVEKLIGMTSVGGPFVNGNMDALIEMARQIHQIRVEPGHVFWKAGDPSSFTIRIIYGRVRCTNPEGTHVDVGSSFAMGSFDAWSGQPRAYTAVAETVVQAYRSDMEDFLPVLEGHVDLAMELLCSLAQALLAGG